MHTNWIFKQININVNVDYAIYSKYVSLNRVEMYSVNQYGLLDTYVRMLYNEARMKW
jgi:hypothetical protein